MRDNRIHPLFYIAIVSLLVIGFLFFRIYTRVNASEYDYIEQTKDSEVVRITNDIASQYSVCPELLQAIVFYESSNQSNAVNQDCVGYMQVSGKWHKERMQQLGVVDLKDGYSNILVGTDYLVELCGKYEDIGLALMKYNGDSQADKHYEKGTLSNYASRILKLSRELERLHGK